MKNFFDNLSKYQKKLIDKTRDLNLKEKISEIKPSELIDKAKEQYSALDQKLHRDKQNLSNGYKQSGQWQQNQHNYDYKQYMGNRMRDINLDRVSEKLRNIDTERIKNTAKSNIESAASLLGNLINRSKSAYNAFKEAKPTNRPINQRNYQTYEQTSKPKPDNFDSRNSNIYTNNHDVPMKNQFTEHHNSTNHQTTGQGYASYLKNAVSRLMPERQRTGYDIYIDNFSDNKSRFSSMYKRNFFVRGYRIFKSNLFWKSLLFCSVLTFVYSYAKHLAMGRSYNQQFEKFMQMQKHINESLQNQKTDNN